jgi:ferredoxin
MKEKGYESPSEITGLSHRKVAGFGNPFFPVSVKVPRQMVVDEEKCDGCGRCVSGCLATSDGAIKLRNKVAYITESICTRCNVCRMVCPTGAISAEWENQKVRL